MYKLNSLFDKFKKFPSISVGMVSKVPECIAPILKRVKESLKKLYGKKLKKIILYGSYARGDATDDSDIDLLILLDDMGSVGEEIVRCSHALGDLELIYDTLISIVPFDAAEFEKRCHPIILNAKREGIII
jgi:predicted nucleotidyltransferase